jgi:hypothetical protein
MAKRLHFLTVRGKQHEWRFHVELDPKYLQDWRDDGLEIQEIRNTVPHWLPSWLMGAWCFVQDVFHMRNPFA